VTEVDETMGMRRVEIMCGNCGGHLGHVFENERGPGTERHCGASPTSHTPAGSFFRARRCHLLVVN
jgi:peptide methionine sulfoxide reductase MsrB